MTEPTKQGDLFSAGVPSGALTINSRCLVRTQDGHRVVVVSGVVLAQYTVGDRMAEAHTMVSLVEQGWADQNDVARAFGVATRTLRRSQRRFEAGGLSALGRPRGYPKGERRLATARGRLVQRLKAEGRSNREIAHRLGVCEKAVRKLLRHLGWKPQDAEQIPLSVAEGADSKLSAFPSPALEPPVGKPAAGANPKLSAFSSQQEPPAVSLDTDPACRSVDRVLARLGLLADAAPWFRPGRAIPRAGVLLAVPALVGSGVFDVAREVYGSLGPAFYGLRTTMLTLLLMALLRVKRPEALKEHAPPELGRLLGLDRAPEVKTLRRKLGELAGLGRAVAFGGELARRRVAARGEVVGFLYVDGHVRVYHGKRTLPKAHVARMRLSMPATTDYWVNDRDGDPLFVVTAEANAGMVHMLPEVLAEVRKLVGKRRVTVAFDRGGYSPKLFARLIADGFDILTYRKGRFRKAPRRCFREHTAVFDGRHVTYHLADQGVRIGGVRLRQVTRLSEDGHATPILTSRRDLAVIEVAYRMFERWRQENFFKYLREEYALDALVDYGVEPADPIREVPNPRFKALDAQLRAARAEMNRLAAQYGVEALVNIETHRPTMRGFKISEAKLGHGIWRAIRRVVDLEKQRARVPRRVPVEQVVDGHVIKLDTERKHLTSLLKMVAYQAEGDLLRQLAPHYRRAAQEGRTLVQSALASAADIEVTDTELRVTLAPLSSPHRTRAVAALCKELNRTETRFPGTRLLLRYAIAESG
jgi:transposase